MGCVCVCACVPHRPMRSRRLQQGRRRHNDGCPRDNPKGTTIKAPGMSLPCHAMPCRREQQESISGRLRLTALLRVGSPARNRGGQETCTFSRPAKLPIWEGLELRDKTGRPPYTRPPPLHGLDGKPHHGGLNPIASRPCNTIASGFLGRPLWPPPPPRRARRPPARPQLRRWASHDPGPLYDPGELSFRCEAGM